MKKNLKAYQKLALLDVVNQNTVLEMLLNYMVDPIHLSKQAM